MILNEFKAWFAGITATMGTQPTIEQWDLIKREIAAIGGDKTAASNKSPFTAYDAAKDKVTPKSDSFADVIRDAIKRSEEKEKQEGINGFPKGWPSRHYDNHPSWPFDPFEPKYNLGNLGDLTQGMTSEPTEENPTVIFFNRR